MPRTTISSIALALGRQDRTTLEDYVPSYTKGHQRTHLQETLVPGVDEGQQGIVPNDAESLEGAGTMRAFCCFQSKRHNT